MKLAEALLERKGLKERIDSLRYRAGQSALVQEGDAPAEPPLDLLREEFELVAQWGVMVRRINATNNQAALPGGETISNAIVRRDELDLKIEGLEQVVACSDLSRHRTSRSEIKFVPAVDVPALRRELDGLSKQRRELDAQIQAQNWSVELAEAT